MLNNKKIVLGICGSIAAYKAALLVRLLVKAGADVKVVMTPEAVGFIGPLTLSTLSKNPVLTEFSNSSDGTWNNHVEIGLWADLLIIAPASANTLAKFSAGICDNLLCAVYLSAKCPVFLAPAMDLDMWKHPSTQANVARLQSFGNILINPGSGELASGLIGEGRMAEPEEIIDFLAETLKKKLPLRGKTALVSAGPTYEALDPVRFIGNHSSGKMGYAIAEELFRLGAEVMLISGPTALEVPDKYIKRILITSADELQAEMQNYFQASDITVMSAAVADYRPEKRSEIKIKKDDNSLHLNLVRTTDILAKLGEQKKPNQLLIGFALETNDETENAIKKLKNKNLDFIVLNSLNDAGAGFKGDLNKVTLIDWNLKSESFELKSKKEVAVDICEKIVKLIHHE